MRHSDRDETDRPTDGESPKIAVATDEDVAAFSAVGSPEAPPADELSRLRAERDDYKDKYLRAQAECANVSRRLTQQHAESLRHAGMTLARALLPTLDNFERVLTSLAGASSDDPIASGVRIVADQLAKALRENGVVPIESVGQPFDPNRQQAVLQDFETDLPAGIVSQELERGYMLHDRVLRPAKVAVSAHRES